MSGNSLLAYQSVKYIKVHNTALALIYYALMFLITIYIIVFQVVLSQGYQEFDSVVSSNMLKVKGAAVANKSGEVWDSYDAVIPAMLPDSIFVATNFVSTPNQQRGVCADAELETPEDCSGCVEGEQYENGIQTGGCETVGNNSFCTARGWCPFEVKPDGIDDNILEGVEDWTLFARVSASFPAFNFANSNTDGMVTPDPNGKALFYLNHIVESANYNWDDVKYKGAILVGEFHYDCNLNKDGSLCQPEVSFHRLDDPNNKFSNGFNFRYIDKTSPAERDLTKLLGVFIIFRTTGQAGKFSYAALGTTLGAGLSFLTLASLICDFLMQYALPNREKYEKAKFQAIQESGASLESPLLTDHKRV